VIRTLVSAGELSLSCARLLAGWMTTMWLRRPLSVSQHGQLSLPSLRDRLMSSNPCYSGLRRQTVEGVLRGVAYRSRQRVLLTARLECRLAAGSRPRNGDECRSLALWPVRESNSHWLGTLSCLLFIVAVTRHHLGLVYYPLTLGRSSPWSSLDETMSTTVWDLPNYYYFRFLFNWPISLVITLGLARNPEVLPTNL